VSVSVSMPIALGAGQDDKVDLATAALGVGTPQGGDREWQWSPATRLSGGLPNMPTQVRGDDGYSGRGQEGGLVMPMKRRRWCQRVGKGGQTRVVQRLRRRPGDGL
jgi:hypothetical protein